MEPKKLNWQKVFQSTSLHQIMIVKGMLEENEIQAQILNKQDSMYIQLNNYTFIELYVAKENILKAIRLIEQQNLDNNE